MRPRLLFLFFTVLMTVGCTIERQHFRNGWHVEWRSHPRSTRQAPVADQVVPENNIVMEDAVIEAPTASLQEEVLQHVDSIRTTEGFSTQPQTKTSVHKAMIATSGSENISISGRQLSLPPEKKESPGELPSHPLTQAMWGVNFGIWALFILLITLLINVTVVSPVVGTLIGLAMLTLFVMNIVFASKVKHDQRTLDPYPYRKARPALIVLAGPLILLLISLFAGVLALFAIGAGWPE